LTDHALRATVGIESVDAWRDLAGFSGGCIVSRVPIVGVVLAIMACGPAIRATPPRGTDGARVFTADDIAQMRVATAWDVVERTGFVNLRESAYGDSATMSTRRGKSSILLGSADVPVLLVNGIRQDDPRMLRQIAAQSIEKLWLVNGIQATIQQGTNSGAGLISIVTKSAPDSI
jgi:hypothetical protein